MVVLVADCFYLIIYDDRARSRQYKLNKVKVAQNDSKRLIIITDRLIRQVGLKYAIANYALHAVVAG